jgi:hypothetical protein
LFTGSAIATPNTNVLAADRFATFCDFKLPDIAQVFTKTEELDFLVGEKGDSIRLIPYMIQQNVTYKTEYKDRPALVERLHEVLARGLESRIEAGMLRLLFYAGLESMIDRKWKFKTGKWVSNISVSNRKFIMNPETIEHFGYDPAQSSDLICSFLLGKNEPFQRDLIAGQEQELSGDLCLRIDSSRSDSIVLTELPNLPPLMGFNTSFEFDAKTLKVTQIPDKREGMELISVAYFSAMAVLDHKSVTLLDLEHNI